MAPKKREATRELPEQAGTKKKPKQLATTSVAESIDVDESGSEDIDIEYNDTQFLPDDADDDAAEQLEQQRIKEEELEDTDTSASLFTALPTPKTPRSSRRCHKERSDFTRVRLGFIRHYDFAESDADVLRFETTMKVSQVSVIKQLVLTIARRRSASENAKLRAFHGQCHLAVSSREPLSTSSTM